MFERIRIPVADLDDESWAAVADAVGRFEQSWQTASGARLGQYLPEADHLRERVLIELIKVDQEFRWESGEQKKMEGYLSDWPQLSRNPEVMSELLEAECVTRAVVDSVPTMNELQARFPEIYDQIDLARIRTEAKKERGSARQTAVAQKVPDTVGEQSLQNTPYALAEKQALRPGSRFGRYQIVDILGKGGMGSVYRARDTQLQREVALKIPRLDLMSNLDGVARFLREAQAAAKIEHSNVCTIYDADEIDGTPYITMKLVNGPSLASFMEDESLDSQQIANITLKLVQALSSVHGKGILHRDIKPSNVMMDEGEPLLMDFGLARPDETDNALTASGALLGTVPYMSPEQVDGDTADFRSDIYSLGVVLYQMLTGELPFTGKLTEMIVKITKSEPAKPSKLAPEIDTELERICLKAMAKSPAARYQSADEMAKALEQFLAELPQPAKPRSRRRWLAAAAFLAGVVITFKTGNGVIELDVPPDAKVRIDGNVVEVEADGKTYVVSVGNHKLQVSVAGEMVDESSFTIRWRGDKARKVVKLTIPAADRVVEKTPPAARPPKPPPIEKVSDENVTLLATIERWIKTRANCGGFHPSRDGSTVYAATWDENDGPLRVLNALTGRIARRIDFVTRNQQHIHGGLVVPKDGRYAFLTNYYDDRMYRIDLENDNAVTQTPVNGVWPNRLGITPDQRKLVVVLGQDNQSHTRNDFLSIVDIDDGRFQELSAVRLPDEPVTPNIAFSADSQHVYVVTQKCESDAPTLYEVSLARPYKITRRLPFPEGKLNGVAVSSKTKRLFVSDAGKIKIVNLEEFEVSGEIELYGYSPGPLAIDADERLLVALCPETNKLVCIDPASGAKLGGASDVHDKSEDLKFSRDGQRLFVMAREQIGVVSTSHLLDRIVFASNREGEGHQIYVMALDGKQLVQLTTNRGTNRSPRWSPGGRRIAFISTHTGQNRTCVINRDGSGLRVLKKTDPVLGSGWEAPLDWSPDGSKVAFIGDEHRALRIVDVKTGEVETPIPGPVAEGFAHHNGLSWSRTGGKILFNSQHPANGRIQEVFQLATKSQKTLRLTHEAKRRQPFVSPAASPDGSKIAAVYTESADALPSNIFLLDANGKDRTPLTSNNKLHHANPRWFPDGRRIVYSAGKDGRHHLYSIRIDGTGLSQLTDGNWDDVEPDIWGAR